MTDDRDDQNNGTGERREPRLPTASDRGEDRRQRPDEHPTAPLRPSAAMRTYLRPAKLKPRLNAETDSETGLRQPVRKTAEPQQDAQRVSADPPARIRANSQAASSSHRQTPLAANDSDNNSSRAASPPPPLPPSVTPAESAVTKSVPEQVPKPAPAASEPPKKPLPVSKSEVKTETRDDTAVGHGNEGDVGPPPVLPAQSQPSDNSPPEPAPAQKSRKRSGLAARLFGKRRKKEAVSQPVADTADEDRRSGARRASDETGPKSQIPVVDTNVEAMPIRPSKVPPQPRLVLENVGLEIRSLGKHFKKRPVLRDVSLRVQRGEAVGLLGPNGAGKTTCFYIVTGLIPADYGEIFLDGHDITSLPMYRRARMGIGYLPQEASIFRGLTVEQNIRAVLELVEKDLERRETALESLLAEFSISHLRRTPAIALSGGERRRLEIARALASQPNFILLDEPLAGIDPIAVRDIRDLVSHLKDRGIGVLITDHNVRETLEIVDRAYILHDGNVLMEGPPEEIVANQEVRRVYLGDRFTL